MPRAKATLYPIHHDPVPWEGLTPLQRTHLKTVLYYALHKVRVAQRRLRAALHEHDARLQEQFEIAGTRPSDRRAITTLITTYSRITRVLLGHQQMCFEWGQLGVASGAEHMHRAGSRGVPPERWEKPGPGMGLTFRWSRSFSGSMRDQARAVVLDTARRVLQVPGAGGPAGDDTRATLRPAALGDPRRYALFAIPRLRTGTRMGGRAPVRLRRVK